VGTAALTSPRSSAIPSNARWLGSTYLSTKAIAEIASAFTGKLPPWLATQEAQESFTPFDIALSSLAHDSLGSSLQSTAGSVGVATVNANPALSSAAFAAGRVARLGNILEEAGVRLSKQDLSIRDVLDTCLDFHRAVDATRSAADYARKAAPWL